MSDSESTQDATDIRSKHSARSVPDTVSRLAELLDARGIRLFAVIDQSAEARSVELGRPG